MLASQATRNSLSLRVGKGCIPTYRMKMKSNSEVLSREFVGKKCNSQTIKRFRRYFMLLKVETIP